MSKLSETLLAARMAKGLRLREVEHVTRIRQSYLRALENDDFSQLPPPVYTRGFIRNYASYLDLDPDQMVNLYDDAIGYRPEPVRIETTQPVRVSALVAPNAAAIAVALVLAGVIFVWLYSAFFIEGPAHSTRLPTPQVATPTALPGVLLPTPTATPAPEQTATPAATVPVAAPNPAATATQSTGTAKPTAAASPTPASSPVPVDGLALQVRVVEQPSWLQVRSDGVVVFTGTLAAGSERTFNAKKEIFIHAGRADAVELTLNGEALGRLGEKGQSVVRRTFSR